MRKLKKSSKEIQELLDNTKEMLREEESNYNECKDKELKECYMQNIIKIKKAIKTFEAALEESKSNLI
ncbi:hypothetical protein [uncultured Clostridium sp.]|uniref:hypothetical protein n=1 Tax=uncultured Clostridium sp. TaxID=59620 RepID=UPI0027DD2AE1|nr:hypothetical protein [uncultured Clostridium sp.]